MDTFFITRLGAPPLAALGIAATLLSSVLWIFNFLGVGSQTRVAQALGRDSDEGVAETWTLTLGVAVALGVVVGLVIFVTAAGASAFMGARAEVLELAVRYLQIRSVGAPAVLIALAAFGVLRGLQDMLTPLWVVVGVNGVNLLLDPILIFGWGAIPAYGVAGAAWASVVAQWLGAVWLVALLRARLPFVPVQWRGFVDLLTVGRDMLLRTGMLLAFLLAATRVANQVSVEAGAVHQVARSWWTAGAFVLDSLAVAGQSLIGYALGAGKLELARRAAQITVLWSLAAGVLVGVFLLAVGPWVALWLPPEAGAAFGVVWLLCAVSQPLNAIAFGTDGVHWGAGDFAYLRTAMLLASGLGILSLDMIDRSSSAALGLVWTLTFVWIAIRAIAGLLRIWPGIGRAPLARAVNPGH